MTKKNYFHSLKASGFGSSTAKPFLVFINPNSGAGKAHLLFKERIVPLWAEANIPYEMVLTSNFPLFYLKVKILILIYHRISKFCKRRNPKA